MTRVIRSRRAPASQDQPLYARMLRLRHLTPSGFLCFVFLEGAVALGILLALAELVSWWGVLVLPAMVAVMVKLNDALAGMLAPQAATPASRPPAAPERPAAIRPPTVQPGAGSPREFQDMSAGRSRTGDQRDRAARVAGGLGGLSSAETVIAEGGHLNGPPASRQWAEEVDVRQQISRQSAARRYE
jgi:hypothetical protein